MVSLFDCHDYENFAIAAGSVGRGDDDGKAL